MVIYKHTKGQKSIIFKTLIVDGKKKKKKYKNSQLETLSKDVSPYDPFPHLTSHIVRYSLV